MALPSQADDRRRGPSRLSTWTGRRITALWVLWPGFVLALVAIAVAASLRVWHGASEVRSDVTRSNIIGLATTVLFPPACLTVVWWRMRCRRRSSVD